MKIQSQIQVKIWKAATSKNSDTSRNTLTGARHYKSTKVPSKYTILHLKNHIQVKIQSQIQVKIWHAAKNSNTSRKHSQIKIRIWDAAPSENLNSS